MGIRELNTAPQFIELAEENGFGNLEIWMEAGLEQVNFFNEFKPRLKNFQITAHYPLHSPRGKMLFSDNVVERRVGMNRVLENLENLTIVDAEIYVIHGGITFAPLKELEIIRDKCKEYGMRLSIENGVNTEFKDLTKLRNLCKLLDVGMAYDVAYAFRAKQNIDDLSPYKDMIEHVHLSDVNTRIDHICLGDGLLPIPQVIHALKKIGYDKTIVLEMSQDPDVKNALVKSKKILEELWSKL